MRRPLLFLDVDGPLIPFGRRSGTYATFTDADRAWVARRHPAPSLLHTVDPSTGLTGQDLATIAAWLTTVA